MSLELSLENFALLASVAVAWVALVYLLMAFGVRRGELVWTGRHPRRLPSHLRRSSLLYAFLLGLSSVLLLVIAGVIEIALIADRWIVSVGFVLTVLLGIAGLMSLFKGSTWERWLFAPIILSAAVIAGLIAFG